MTSEHVDARVYQDEIRPWLPDEIVDIHTHVVLAEHVAPISPERMAANWALEVGIEQSWEDLRENYRSLFADQRVTALAFGGVFQEVDIEASNSYVLSGANDPRNNALGLLVTRPEWDADVIAEAISQGFVGIKPYPDLAPQPTGEVSIFDFCPRSHLEALNELKGILMLHLPRAGRLGDADNIRELVELSESYPDIKLIVAHIGRSFCLPTARKGLPSLAKNESVYFDTSANLNADVFWYAIETVGADRLLFGSDLPITLMRGVREHIGEEYINHTDAPYSWNTNRKSPEEEAQYTYFLYEELRALIAAAQRSGIGKAGLEKILYSNGARLLNRG